MISEFTLWCSTWLKYTTAMKTVLFLRGQSHPKNWALKVTFGSSCYPWLAEELEELCRNCAWSHCEMPYSKITDAPKRLKVMKLSLGQLFSELWHILTGFLLSYCIWPFPYSLARIVKFWIKLQDMLLLFSWFKFQFFSSSNCFVLSIIMVEIFCNRFVAYIQRLRWIKKFIIVIF